MYLVLSALISSPINTMLHNSSELQIVSLIEGHINFINVTFHYILHQNYLNSQIYKTDNESNCNGRIDCKESPISTYPLLNLFYVQYSLRVKTTSSATVFSSYHWFINFVTLTSGSVHSVSCLVCFCCLSTSAHIILTTAV